MMMHTTTAILTTSVAFVSCCTCKQPVMRKEANEIRLLEHTGRVRNGRPVFRVTDQIKHECDSCFEKHPDDAA